MPDSAIRDQKLPTKKPAPPVREEPAKKEEMKNTLIYAKTVPIF